jgi:hypothetical protein
MYDSLAWDTSRKTGAYTGQAIYDHDLMNGGAHVGLPSSHSSHQQQPVALTQQAIAHVQRRSVQGIPPRRQSGSAAQQPLQQQRQSGVAAPDVSHLLGRNSKQQQQQEIDYEPVLRAPIATAPRRSSQSYADADAAAAAGSNYAENAYAAEREYRDQSTAYMSQQQQQQQLYHSEQRRLSQDSNAAVVPASVPGLRYTPQAYSSDSSAANSARSGTFARAGAASLATEPQSSTSDSSSVRRNSSSSSSDHHCRDEAALAEMRYSQQSYHHLRDKARATTQLW